MGHKLGIIGFGGMGSWHFEKVRGVEGLGVSAVHDIDPERVEEARRRGVRGYDDLESFLRDESFDIVLVAVPNNFHRPLALAAVAAGKNVICEKPAALNGAEFDEMCAAAEKAGKLLTCHQNRRWDRDYQMVRKTIGDGKLGKPYIIESRISGQNGILFNWRDKKASGGGVFLDWAPHMIDQLLMMDTSPVRKVYARMFSLFSKEVEDYFRLDLTFESGLMAMAEVGTFCLVKSPRWLVHGERGSMVIDDFSCNGRIVTDSGYVLNWTPEIANTEAGPTRTMAPRPPETMIVDQLPDVSGRTDWSEYYRNIMDHIDGRAELLVKPEQVRRTMAVMDSGFESARLGKSLDTDI